MAVEGEGEEGDVQMLDDDEMQQLMGNREYLESVLSSLPGVNPEEALHNLEEMRQAAQQQEEEKTETDTDKQVCTHARTHAHTHTHTHTHTHHSFIFLFAGTSQVLAGVETSKP